MPPIPWPLSTSPGIQPQEGAGRLINAYAVPRGENLGPVWYRAPGLLIFGADQGTSGWRFWSLWEQWFGTREQATGLGTFRGGVEVNSTLYGVFGTGVYTVDSSGAFTSIGSLAGTDQVFFARNNAGTPDIVMVCNAGAFVISGGAVVTYPDADVGSPTCVCFHEGWFFFGYGSGLVRASGINSTSINTLDNTTAESNPDGVSRVWSYGGQLFVGGPQTIEMYGLPVNSVAFPLTRVGYNITPGLISATAVAGFEPEFANSPLYVGSNNTVQWLHGLTPEKVSPPDLDALIAAVSDKSTIETLVYVANGHPFFQVSSASWTWAFNLNNNKWHERQSYQSVRSRMTRSVVAFDQWLVGDQSTGNLLQISPAALAENGDPLKVIIESGPADDFPNRMRVNRADFRFTTGVGSITGTDPIQTDPTCEISWSDDGGVTWKGPWQRKLGQQGEPLSRIFVGPTGLTGDQGRRWRLGIADPVHVGFMGGDMSAQVRAG